MSVAEISAVIGGGALLLTIGVLLVKASVRFGRLETKVDSMADAVNARFGQLETKVDELMAEVRQTNRTMAALANHRHDVDGNTVFTVPG
jgi:outer membrane murein-binding lipoprotein Lpp